MLNFEKINFFLLRQKILKNWLKYIMYACYVFIFFLALSFLVVLADKILFHEIKKKLSNKVALVSEAIINDQESIASIAANLSASSRLKTCIKEKDIACVVAILEDERREHDGVELFAVDDDGVVLARTQNLSRNGDYFFQTTEWGAAIKRGKISSVESGITDPLMIIGGEPIFENGNFIGALFVKKNIDKEYADKIKSAWLGGLSQIAFFSNDKNYVSSSFINEKDISALRDSFNSGSKWMSNDDYNDLDLPVNLNNNLYLIDNFEFEGLTKNNGGAIIFYNYNILVHNLLPAGIIFLIVSALIIMVAYIKRRFIGLYVKFFVSFSIIFLTFIVLWNELIFTSFSSFLILGNNKRLHIYNSILKIEPEYGILSTKYVYKVDIKISSGDEAINAVQAVINFDNQKIKVIDIDSRSSFCKANGADLFVEKKIDNVSGVVTIACGLPAPGFSGENGIVAQLSFQPLKDGLTGLSFGDGTMVLANDGLGTNVLRDMAGASYFLTSYEKNLDILGTIGSVIVYSSTHPNSGKWYNSNEINISWKSNLADSYIYAFDQSPESIPPTTSTTSDTDMTFEPKNDGVYYFHIAGEKEGIIGPVQHYKIMIDRTPPDSLKLLASETSVQRGGVVMLGMKAKDDISGLQSDNFYIKIDNSIFMPTKSPIYIPFMESGNHQVSVKVFDKAGNEITDSMNIFVQSGSWVDEIRSIDFSAMWRNEWF